MDYILQAARPENLATVLTWVATPEALKLWGGPVLTFPPRVEKTWAEIGATDQNTFSLLDATGNVVGMGQLLLREPASLHLARIIVSPAMRGKGIGRILCQQLLEAGAARFQTSQFTLNVYKDNVPAINLYTSLGFTVVSEDLEQNWLSMCLRLHAEPTSSV